MTMPSDPKEALERLLEKATCAAPAPLPEQGSRTAEAMAGRADDEARRRWSSERESARTEIVALLPQFIASREALAAEVEHRLKVERAVKQVATEALAQRAALEEVVRRCKAQFEFYVEQHMAKSPPDTAKAEANEHFAALCRNALLDPTAPVEEERAVKRTMTINLTDEEMAALDKLAAEKDLKPPLIFRQALRVYQLYCLPEGHPERIARSPSYGADRMAALSAFQSSQEEG